MPRPVDKRRFTENNTESTPKSLRLYRLNKGPKVSYVGSAENLAERLDQHEANPRFLQITSFDLLRTPTTRQARVLEKRRIEKHEPPQNH
jgi:excinuclease UvrABC nuclease subunit